MQMHREKMVLKERQKDEVKAKRKKEADERLLLATGGLVASTEILGRQLTEDNGRFTMKLGGTHNRVLQNQVSKLCYCLFCIISATYISSSRVK